jgi:hypothetical protein
MKEEDEGPVRSPTQELLEATCYESDVRPPAKHQAEPALATSGQPPVAGAGSQRRRSPPTRIRMPLTSPKA